MLETQYAYVWSVTQTDQSLCFGAFGLGFGQVALDLLAQGLFVPEYTQLMQAVHGLAPPPWAPSGETTKAINSAASVAAAVKGSAHSVGVLFVTVRSPKGVAPPRR